MFNLQLRLGQETGLIKGGWVGSGSVNAAFSGCYKILFVANSAVLYHSWKLND